MESQAPALSRGIALLRCLGRDGAASLEQLAHATDCPKSSCLRLLTTLVELGCVERDPVDKRYRAREHLAPMAALAPGLSRCMEQLCQQSACTAEIWRLRDGGLQLSDRREPEGVEVRVSARIGFTRALDELEAVTQIAVAIHGRKRGSTNFWAWHNGQQMPLPKDRIAQVLKDCRQHRYAIDLGINSNAVRRYAIALPGTAGAEGILALAQVCGPQDRKPSDHLLSCLTQTAAAIGQALS